MTVERPDRAVRPAAVPLRPPRRGRRGRGAPRRRDGRPVGRHAVRPAARRRCCARSPRRTASAATRRRIGTPELRDAGEPLDRSALRRRRARPRSRPASARRSSSARCRSGCACGAPTATPCSTRPCRYPDLRDGRDPRRLPRRCRCRVDDGWRLDLDAIDERDAERALCLWVNSPGNPTGALDDLGRGGGVGPGPRHPRVQRRVLRRVHVGRSAALDPRARRSTASSPCTRCRSDRTSPACGSASTPAIPSSCSYLQRGAQARRDDGARSRAGGGRRRARRRRARRRAADRYRARLERDGEGAR